MSLEDLPKEVACFTPLVNGYAVFLKPTVLQNNVLSIYNTIEYHVKHVPNDAELGGLVRNLLAGNVLPRAIVSSPDHESAS